MSAAVMADPEAANCAAHAPAYCAAPVSCAAAVSSELSECSSGVAEAPVPQRCGWPSGFSVARAVLASTLVLAACCAGLRPSDATARVAGSIKEAMMLQAKATCEDAQEWSNGNADCKGIDGPECTSEGLTCGAYKANPDWCNQQGMIGEDMNYPELNCCACGGGTMLSAGEATFPVAESTGQCVDDADWANGFIACANQLTEKDGCGSGGLTCEGYVLQGFCAGGQIAAGFEYTAGGGYNHPEIHCCACGKIPGSTANIIW